MDKFERGMLRINEILGADANRIIDSFKNISPDFARYTTEFAYGELYSRNGLNDKTKEVIAVTSLITQGNTGLPLKAHIKGMLNVGWSKDEILEVIILLIGYVGFPKTVDALKTAEQVFTEHD